MSEIVDPERAGEALELPVAPEQVRPRKPGTFQKGQSGNPTGKPKAPAADAPPKRNQVLVDLEWAYRNSTDDSKKLELAKGRARNRQQQMFLDDFLTDRAKTLALLVKLQGEHKDEVKAWMAKVATGASGVNGTSTSHPSGTAESAGNGIDSQDEGEERVREMMQRLLLEANRVSAQAKTV